MRNLVLLCIVLLPSCNFLEKPAPVRYAIPAEEAEAARDYCLALIEAVGYSGTNVADRAAFVHACWDVTYSAYKEPAP